jgi:F-type H+-transporting ATPase subunit a
LDINNRNLWILDIGGIEVWITQTLVNTWIIMAVLIIVALIIRSKLKKFEEVPGTFQNIVEFIIEAFDKYVKGIVRDDKLMFIGNWFFAATAFILLSNLSGILGMRPPTSDWPLVFAYALSTFALIQVVGFRFKGKKYIKTFFEPNPVFLPLNLIGEFARPISLSFRLFGNILAGMTLMMLFYSLVPIVVQFFLPAALHGFFDLFSGTLQAYIFITLSLTFIATTVAD